MEGAQGRARAPVRPVGGAGCGVGLGRTEGGRGTGGRGGAGVGGGARGTNRLLPVSLA